ncbi:ATP-dependent DNA helicase RecQ [Chondrus crispus]|uniref:ATP-dependent DNA helicase n=1 Tax=Chondrus crispus TaxID=2769 RepID=R7Q4Y6_CHOCR|nr:ATP-dependent DNA helicase RecQ [Chondrus crispus]CDF32495.1 ATP-dependent DNA helicase RecQ [Chondrus crispus]|eukprot:XP_005712160.1 ATP-dependent DNA helicase RecQ [Chondrus crispus]
MASPPDIPPSAHYHATLKKYFGPLSLRPQQAPVISALLSGQDVLLTAPTGHGKSLCFQLPALVHHEVSGAVSLVVSPLLALMNNQVTALLARGVPTALLSSAETVAANRKVLTALDTRGAIPFAMLYITPERLVKGSFMSLLRRLHHRGKLGILAIDEAHCISQWGHDFRTAYSRMGVIRDDFPTLPIVALTATATAKVRADIISSLHIPNARHIHTSFLRANIRYEVRYADTMETDVSEDLRVTVEDLTVLLQSAGVPAVGYHGGMSAGKRKEAQHLFETGQRPVAVASIAFGMGIDVAGIRYVVHHSLPKSVEAFYQESGRAGRDGLPSESVLYYSKKDLELNEYLLACHRKKSDEKRMQAAVKAQKAMKEYCTNVKCRRVALLEYFGEEASAAKVCGRSWCDVCFDPKDVKRRKRRTQINLSVPPRAIKSASSRPSTPAADFQTARSMMQSQQRTQKAAEEQAEVQRARKPRSHIISDDIADFSSGDEICVDDRAKLEKLKTSKNFVIDLIAIEKAEEAYEKKRELRRGGTGRLQALRSNKKPLVPCITIDDDDRDPPSRLKLKRGRPLLQPGEHKTQPRDNHPVKQKKLSLGRVGFRRISPE